MARKARKKEISPVGLLTLPNEILIHIVSFLRVPDVQRLGGTNRELFDFVKDYLAQYRYNDGLVALPNEIILEIVDHLGHQKYRSRLARASQRFYPVIMDYMFRHNVRHGSSGLLHYAAKNNLKRVARKMLHVGADVDTQRATSITTMETPLATAAFYGHEEMAWIFLEAGASLNIGGMSIPLVVAIRKRRENVAMMLSQEMERRGVPFNYKVGTALQMACKAKLVKLVRYYLSRGSRCNGHADTNMRNDCSIALVHVLREDVRKEQVFKRELHEDVYQIVVGLLQHGANPDAHITDSLSSPINTRAIASRHPDPRVRALLAKPGASKEFINLSPLIGRPWMVATDDDSSIVPYAAEWEELPSEVRRHAKLSDLISWSSPRLSGLIELEGIEDKGSDCEERLLEASLLADLVKSETRRFESSQGPIEPPPILSFPQLGVPKVRETQPSAEFWARKKVETPPYVISSGVSPVIDSRTMASKQKHRGKPTKRDPFPQLGELNPTSSNDAAKDLWARFARGDIAKSTDGDLPASPREEDGIRQSVRKKSRKKWEPLSF